MYLHPTTPSLSLIKRNPAPCHFTDLTTLRSTSAWALPLPEVIASPSLLLRHKPWMTTWPRHYFIWPSEHPAIRILLCQKGRWGSSSCINYCGLGKITMKNHYPLHLMDGEPNTHCRAQIFTKHDPQIAYNLLCICNINEWKMAFTTPIGHYKYFIVPFRLSNSSTIFQTFINENPWDMLHKCVFVYFNDMLIFFKDLQVHICHFHSVLQVYCKF